MIEKKILGVLGGMGPLATKVFYEMIIENTDAEKDQDHIEMFILSDAKMPDRTEAILSGNHDTIINRMHRDFKMLEQAGASYAVVTCNTAHYFVNLIRDKLNIPVIHMIEETAKHVAALKHDAKVTILATEGTINSKLYQNALENEGLTAIVPSEEIQKKVMSLIYDYIKAGKDVPKDFFKSIEESLDSDFTLMACTELSCFKKENNLGDFYIDPMEILCKKAIVLCGGKIK